MKKLWIVSSIVIITVVFIYTMSFVSSQNKCTWVRIYECTVLEKQKADLAATKLAEQQAVAQAKQQKTDAAAQLLQQQAKQRADISATQSIQQQTVAKQKADAAAQLAKQQAAAKAAQLLQQQAAARVNTTTRAS